MPDASPISQTGSDVTLRVRVQPKSSRNAVHLEPDGVLRIWTTAPAQDGKANRAIRAFIAKCVGVPKRRVAIASGETSRVKRIVISDIGVDAVHAAIKVEAR